MNVLFDVHNPDKTFVSKALYEAYKNVGFDSPSDIHAEAICLLPMDVSEWEELRDHMLKNQLIEKTDIPGDFYRLTQKGEDVSSGADY